MEKRKCQLKGRKVSVDTCKQCMYHTEDKCLKPLNLTPSEFAEAKDVSTQELSRTIDLIKHGLLLNEYAQWMQGRVNKSCSLNSAVFRLYISNKVYGDLGISYTLFTELCDKDNFAAFLKHAHSSSILQMPKVLLTDAHIMKGLNMSNSKTTLSRMSLRELEQQGKGSIFVINATRGDRRGNIVLSVARTQGTGFDTMMIPMTWIPIELTTLASYAQLIADSSFRQAVATEMIHVVNAEQAQNYLESNEAARQEAIHVQRRMTNTTFAETVDDSSGTELEIEVPSVDADTWGDQQEEISAPMQAVLQQFLAAQDLNKREKESAYASLYSQIRRLGEQPREVYLWLHRETRNHDKKFAKQVRDIASEFGVE